MKTKSSTTKAVSKSSKSKKPKKDPRGGYRESNPGGRPSKGPSRQMGIDMRMPIFDGMIEAGIQNRTEYINRLIANDLVSNTEHHGLTMPTRKQILALLKDL